MSDVLIALAAASIANCEGTQVQMNACAEAVYRSADRKMGQQWNKTYAAFKRNDKDMADYISDHGPAAEALLKAQRSWLQYREQSCEAQARLSPGSIFPVNYFFCMASLTEARTEELKNFSKDPNSGDPL